MNSNKFEWTPKRVQEFTAIYAGNFTGNKRFSRSDFIGLRYEDIMSRIVLPNMGWRANSNESIEARGEIGEAIEVLLNDVDRYYK